MQIAKTIRALLVPAMAAGFFAPPAALVAKPSSAYLKADKQALANVKLPGGAKYQASFVDAIDAAIRQAMTACVPGTTAPTYVRLTFVISADGKKVSALAADDGEKSRCMLRELKFPPQVPKPPRDKWAVAAVFKFEPKDAEDSGRGRPPDKPISAAGETQVEKLERALAPYIKAGQESYPAAKERYLAGLPKGQKFEVLVKLYNKDKTLRETSFVVVQKIEDGKISGKIGNKLNPRMGMDLGDAIVVPEAEVLDWTIVREDGTEEGNVVGKFLDTYDLSKDSPANP